MIDGIDAIIDDEAYRKRLKRICRMKRKKALISVPGNNLAYEIYNYWKNEKCECIEIIKEKFIEKGRVPQVVDIDDFKDIY